VASGGPTLPFLFCFLSVFTMHHNQPVFWEADPHTAGQAPSLHPLELDVMMPVLNACPATLPHRFLRNDQCNAGTFGYILPVSAPFLPSPIASLSIHCKPLQIASSGSPEISLSVSLAISREPIINRTDYVLQLRTDYLLLTNINHFLTENSIRYKFKRLIL